jgi:hypothetical protein
MADVLVGVIVHRTVAAGLACTATPARGCPGLCAGLGLALALRCALTDAAWPWLLLSLLAAGAAHVVDVVRRWRMSGAPRCADVPNVPMRGL